MLEWWSSYCEIEQYAYASFEVNRRGCDAAYGERREDEAE